jgi:phosphoinositide-3-kinase regulatory subunit
LQGHEAATLSDTVSVAKALMNAHKQYTAKVKMYGGYSEDFSCTNRDMCLKRYALEAFQVAMKIFENQIVLLENFQKHTQASEIQNTRDNINLLKHHLKCVQDGQRQVEDKMKQQFAYCHTLKREMLTLKPDIIQLFRLKETYQG